MVILDNTDNSHTVLDNSGWHRPPQCWWCTPWGHAGIWTSHPRSLLHYPRERSAIWR